MKFGEMIRILRVGKRFSSGYVSARELAKSLKWPPEKVTRIEKGLEIPSNHAIREMGKALGLGGSAIDQLVEMARQSEVEPLNYCRGPVIVCKRPGGCFVKDSLT